MSPETNPETWKIWISRRIAEMQEKKLFIMVGGKV